MKLREAAQQALEALLTYEQYIQPLTNYFGGPRVPEEGSASAKVDAAITALRAALAEDALDRMSEDERRLGIQLSTHSTEPLTEEEIEEINRDLPLLHMQARKGSVAVVFARAIERAHGIGGGDD